MVMGIRTSTVFLITGVVSMAACGRTPEPTKEPVPGVEVGYFSSDYREARARFIDASLAAGADMRSFESPETGPDGKPLYTDVALLGPKGAGTILVLGSGTPGDQ
jgi:hypothetical protein